MGLASEHLCTWPWIDIALVRAIEKALLPGQVRAFSIKLFVASREMTRW